MLEDHFLINVFGRKTGFIHFRPILSILLFKLFALERITLI